MTMKRKANGPRSQSAGPKRNGVQPSRVEPREFPIVGIGASAGGLEAYTEFLKALPPNLGMAFVLVPHLDPFRKSAFTQILARATSMPVLQIVAGMRVEPDNVYVIPPNCDLTITGGVLHLGEREQPRSVNTSVDIFLRSLAADQGPNAIGIIFSGTASDGTNGLTAIKGEGGITFAQDTRSAKYDGMPASAIAAGCVDLVLPPEGIAQELARIRQHPFVAGPCPEPLDITEGTTEAQMAQIFRLLRRATKVDFSEYKPPTIGRRIRRRMVLHRIEGLGDYVALLQRDRNEINALYQDLLINVTSFFRNPEAFEALKQVVYPVIAEARRASHSPIRIWVPGCSTGEETYSHAISLVEFLGEERSEIPIQIFGTDLSEAAIQRARAGIYKESIESDVSPVRLRRFFQKLDSGYQISKKIRDLCIFSTQNVFSDPPFSRMDLVSCRNVMIYLSQSLQRRMIPVFHYALNPTGFLMIGSTEGLLGTGSELFEMADKKQRIYLKKLRIHSCNVRIFRGTDGQSWNGRRCRRRRREPAETQRFRPELQREADRLLLTRYAPPSVVINQQLEILQSAATRAPSLNCRRQSQPEPVEDGAAGLAVRAAERDRGSAQERHRSRSAQNVRVEDNGGPTADTVRVTSRSRTPVQDHNSFLMVFRTVTR